MGDIAVITYSTDGENWYNIFLMWFDGWSVQLDTEGTFESNGRKLPPGSGIQFQIEDSGTIIWTLPSE